MPVSALVKVACRRWMIEESFAAGKELAALDERCRRPSPSTSPVSTAAGRAEAAALAYAPPTGRLSEVELPGSGPARAEAD
jgi:hypothetical protein